MTPTITPIALAEIDAILAYVFERSPRGAASLALRFDAAFAHISRNPGIGTLTNTYGVRRLVVARAPYLVFYQADRIDVTIIAVRHAARRPTSMPG